MTLAEWEAAKIEARAAIRRRQTMADARFRRDIRRRWINAPSAHDEFFGLHGCNVFADYTDWQRGQAVPCYIVAQDVLPDFPLESYLVDDRALAIGWKNPETISTGAVPGPIRIV